MLSYVWVSVRGALISAARFWICGTAAPHCGRLFRDHTLGVKVTGSFIEAIVRSLAAWRSAARASAGYGDISATGLPRLVMTTCSPVSTAERTSEKR